MWHGRPMDLLGDPGQNSTVIQGHRKLQDGATIQVLGGKDWPKGTPVRHAFDTGSASEATFTFETALGCEWPLSASKAWHPTP
jgi:hypothetical protein